VFTTALNSFNNVDTIRDFSVPADTISLDDAIFRGLAVGALPSDAFALGVSATQGDDRIIYDPATGKLYFDPDGSGSAAQIQFAALSPNLALAATDFILI
jgi:Ca2+-binding RTX toxin-like protein